MTTVHLEAEMPALPSSPPPIFTLPVPAASERALLRLAARFDLNAGERHGRISRHATAFTYSEGAFDLTLHRASGGFRFADRHRWQVDHGSNVDLADNEAARLARAHPKKLDLLPSEVRVLRVSRLHVATAGPDRVMEDHRVIDVAVHLQPIVRGLPLDGPGGKLTVYLDHEKSVTCVDFHSRRIGRVYREVTRLHPPERAVEAARRRWEARGVMEVEVNDVRLCYYEMGRNDRQRYLQPAYLVLATLIGADRRIRTGDIYVSPAAANAVGRIVPTPPRPTPQRPRAARGGSRARAGAR
jgi:hypothetical protein